MRFLAVVSALQRLLVVVVGVVPFGFANAQIVVEAQEMMVLPPYCRHAQTFTSRTDKGIEYWSQRLGPVFPHIHHYCWALVRLHRANKFGVIDPVRSGHYQAAITDINYVIERASAEFVLLPEILTRKGEALLKIKRFTDAALSFEQAIQAKSEYWPAYKGLAETYLAQSQYEKARTVLQKGIAASSDPRMLEMMLSNLPRR